MLGRSRETGRRSGRQAQLAKDELRTVESVAQKQIDVVPRPFKKKTANAEAQHKNRERELQTEAPKNGFEFDGFAISGKEIREAKHCEQAEHPGVTSHALSSFCLAGTVMIV